MSWGDFGRFSLFPCIVSRDDERGMSYGGMNVHDMYVFSIPFLAMRMFVVSCAMMYDMTTCTLSSPLVRLVAFAEAFAEECPGAIACS